MTAGQLVYRGVPYSTHHCLPSLEPVEHVYRGVHYRMPLKHEPRLVDESLDLHYRGHIYHHLQHQQNQPHLEAG